MPKMTLTIPALPAKEDQVWTAQDFEQFVARVRKMQHRRKNKCNFPTGHPKTRTLVAETGEGDTLEIEVAIRLYWTDIFMIRANKKECMVRVNGYRSSLTTKRMTQVQHIIRHLIGRPWNWSNDTTPEMTPEQTMAFGEVWNGPYKRFFQGPGCWASQPQVKYKNRRYFFEITKDDLMEFLASSKDTMEIKAHRRGKHSMVRREAEMLSSSFHPTLIMNDGEMGTIHHSPIHDRFGFHTHTVERGNFTEEQILLLQSVGIKIRTAKVDQSTATYGRDVRNYVNAVIPTDVMRRIAYGKLDHEVWMAVHPLLGRQSPQSFMTWLNIEREQLTIILKKSYRKASKKAA